MTAIQIREPARTPREAQSAGSPQLHTAVYGALVTIALILISVAIAVLIEGPYPTCALLVMCLVPLLVGPARDPRGRAR